MSASPTNTLPDQLRRLREALPALIAAAHLDLPALLERSALLLHGSLTMEAFDDLADIDLWVVTDHASSATFHAKAGTRFIDFRIHRPGHFQVESIDDFRTRVKRCDLPLVAELRDAIVLSDPTGITPDLLTTARRPMSDAVRRAWFGHHYIEMRSHHRGCDGCIERGQAVSLLIAVSRTLEHALQAAMVLDRQPYRYTKWLATLASRTPTGAKVVPLADELTKLIGAGALHHPGPEGSHPLTLKLKQIRQALIESARAGGINEPWLDQWWLHLDKARAGMAHVTWS